MTGDETGTAAPVGPRVPDRVYVLTVDDIAKIKARAEAARQRAADATTRRVVASRNARVLATSVALDREVQRAALASGDTLLARLASEHGAAESTALRTARHAAAPLADRHNARAAAAATRRKLDRRGPDKRATAAQCAAVDAARQDIERAETRAERFRALRALRRASR